MKTSRSGFSLLEVILALALLGGAVVVLGEVCRLALQNASNTRDLARAQMLCESKMAEINSGITPPSGVENQPFDPNVEPTVADDPHWVYDIVQEQSDEEGLISVKVTVRKDLPAAQHPINFSLVRWMLDPNSSTSEELSSGTSGTNSSGGTSNGGA
jgi:prepilin-type N-terminal cleavage/methylation domain-containing protein